MKVLVRKDRCGMYHTVEEDINTLKNELVRIANMPKSSWENNAHLRSLVEHVHYLEEVLSNFERDQKKSFE